MESLLNKSVLNAPPANFETEIIGMEQAREIDDTQDESVQMTRSVIVSEDSNRTEEDVMAENLIEFDQQLTGSATTPIFRRV